VEHDAHGGDVAPEEAATGPNPEEAATLYNPEEEGAPCWGRREERHCRCHWGRREEQHGLHACAPSHLRMPLPMGKKRGVPWSARVPSCLPLPLPMLEKKGGVPLPMPLGKKRGVSRSPRLCAAAPPVAVDVEEEGSAAAGSRLIDPRSGASMTWGRSRWGLSR
jgi:hypothetical protein